VESNNTRLSSGGDDYDDKTTATFPLGLVVVGVGVVIVVARRDLSVLAELRTFDHVGRSNGRHRRLTSRPS
jgi:hypothetical protein